MSYVEMIGGSHFHTERVTKFSGVVSKPGPKNPYRTPVKESYYLRRSRVASSIRGRYIENSVLGILSQQITPGANDTLQFALSEMVKRLNSDLSGVEITNDYEFSRVYEGLTENPEIPFSLTGNERLKPSLEALEILFSETDDIFYSNKDQSARENDIAQEVPESQVNFQKSFLTHGNGFPFRYDVETAMILARSYLSPDQVISGQVIPNVWIRDNNKPVTQFDGIIVPSGINLDPNDLGDYVQKSSDWVIYGVKSNFRWRIVMNKHTLRNPFPRDIAQLQNQIAQTLFHSPNLNICLPSYAILAYPRGLNYSQTHLVRIDHQFVSSWANILEANLNLNWQREKRNSESGTTESEFFFTPEEEELVRYLIRFLRSQVNKMDKPREIEKFSQNGSVQLPFANF